MNQAVLNQAKDVQINDFVFKKIEGYPLFGFRFDEEKQQYAIANLKSKTYTMPFIDDVEINVKPLLTWVANYVVARIQDKWYLCDCDGNCYQESDSPITICRNLFVIEKDSSVITQSLKRKVVSHLSILETHSKQYLFASIPDSEKYLRLFDIDGNVSSIISGNKDELIHWKARKRESTYFSYISFGVDFKTTKNQASDCKIIGKKSITFAGYQYSLNCFSARLNDDGFTFYQYGELEVLIGNGKTYFFKTIDEIDEIDFEIPVPQKIGDTIVYREGKKIVERDLQGNILSENSISPVEAYQLSLWEKH